MNTLNFNITDKFEFGKVCDISFSADGEKAIFSDNTESAKLLFPTAKKSTVEIHDKKVKYRNYLTNYLVFPYF